MQYGIFCAHFAILKCIGLSCTLRSFLINDFITSRIGHLEYIGSLNYELFQILTHFIIQYWKITFVNVITSLTKKSLGTGKLSRSGWQIQLFQNSNFHLKALILSLATNIISCFPTIILQNPVSIGSSPMTHTYT